MNVYKKYIAYGEVKCVKLLCTVVHSVITCTKTERISAD